MKTPIKCLSAIAFTLILSGCSEDSLRMDNDADCIQMPILLSAAYPTVTRASDAGFDDKDQMGVYVLDYAGDIREDISGENIHASNIRFDFNAPDNTWKGSTSIYWTSKDTPADIIGYYPYISNIDNAASVSHSIRRHQDQTGADTQLGGYESSDFLWGMAQKVNPTDSRIDLTFNHLMAGVRVTLVEGSGFASGEWTGLEKSVLVSNIKPNVNINLDTGFLSEASGEVISVVPYQNGEDWRAVVVPQSIASGSNVIDITVGGVSYHLTKSGAVEYIAGKLNTFTITVDKRTSDGGLEFSLSDEGVTAWLDDVDFRDGIMREYVILDCFTKGTLEACVAKKGLREIDIVNLKIRGNIDEHDFQYIRENLSSLKCLNLAEADVFEDEQKGIIPETALSGMVKLNHFIFPKNLRIIGHCAFYGCGLMGDLIIPEGVTHIGTNAQLEDMHPGHVGGGEGVFTDCSSLVGTLTLPSTLVFIESAAFCRTCLTGELRIPESVNFIGGMAFDTSKFTGSLNLPDNVKEIGIGAFFRVPFTGVLNIPLGIKVIREQTFSDGNYSGVSLPEGIVAIDTQAFAGCGFKGELKLPSTLKRLGFEAFRNNKISSVIFPESLNFMGDGCFAENSRLSGTVTIPDGITAINSSTFADCSMLEEVVIGENITKIEGEAFGRCYNLTSLVVNNPEPPLLTNSYWGLTEYRDPFHGVPKDNFTLQVPEESIGVYGSATGWKEFKRIAAYSNFVCRPAKACALTTTHRETLVLNSDGEWEITHIPSWCSLSKTSGNGKTELNLTIKEMSKGSGDRSDYIEFALKGTEFTTKCAVSQYDYEYAEDECMTLQKASRGNGIDILFVGDGFDAEAIAKGEYLDLVNKQIEAFFGVEPYASYRDYFNVYSCISLSQETGVNTANTWRNTRFLTRYAYDCEGIGCLLIDDMDQVFDYAVKHSPLSADRMSESLIIMALNSDEYGGATSLTWNGSAISICSNSSDPYPSDVRGIVQHEACGHAFGKLGEEKIQKNMYAPKSVKDEIQEGLWRGWYHNLSLSGKMNEVGWRDLIFDPRYSDKVDIFEGGYGYTRGVYRAEINSCMNYGIPYFSAPARLDIMRRILEYSGEGFTMEKFFETDSDKWGSTGSTRAVLPDEGSAYVNSGLHHPVRIVKSKKY